MIEHELLMVVAAPLLVLARPGGAMMWALPARWRGPIGGIGRTRWFSATWRFLTDPLVATVLHAVALWAWHMPALYNAVLTDGFAHWLQHLSFFITALLFWWSLLQGRARARGYGAAVFYLFATALHTALLGVLLTVSKGLWYPGQGAFAASFGLTPLEDQQFAGLVMWVPAGLVYAGVALALAGFDRPLGREAYPGRRPCLTGSARSSSPGCSRSSATARAPKRKRAPRAVPRFCRRRRRRGATAAPSPSC